jgi:hypothetical protein
MSGNTNKPAPQNMKARLECSPAASAMVMEKGIIYACWLVRKGEGELRESAYRLIPYLSIGLLIFLTLVFGHALAENLRVISRRWPGRRTNRDVPANAMSAIVLAISVRKRRDGPPFYMVLLIFAALSARSPSHSGRPLAATQNAPVIKDASSMCGKRTHNAGLNTIFPQSVGTNVRFSRTVPNGACIQLLLAMIQNADSVVPRATIAVENK